MKTLVIKESKWNCGSLLHKAKNSSLLNNEGKMCCLGFLGKACGASNENLLGVGSPVGLPKVKWTEGILTDCAYKNNSVLCQTMIRVNDQSDITLEQRRTKLRELFKKIGITLRFVK